MIDWTAEHWMEGEDDEKALIPDYPTKEVEVRHDIRRSRPTYFLSRVILHEQLNTGGLAANDERIRYATLHPNLAIFPNNYSLTPNFIARQPHRFNDADLLPIQQPQPLVSPRNSNASSYFIF